MFLFGHLFLGVLLGLAISRAIRWRRFHHGFHGGCGRMGHGPWGLGFGGWHRFGHHMGGRRLFWLIRDLGLSTEQMQKLKEVWLKGRGAVAGIRASSFEAMHAVAEAALSEPLDRAQLDEAARRYADDHAQAARDLVESLERAHAILTPEQRAKLRERFGRFGADFGAGRGPLGPDGGPYRSGTYL